MVANKRSIVTPPTSRSVGASLTVAAGLVAAGLRVITAAGERFDDALEVDAFSD